MHYLLLYDVVEGYADLVFAAGEGWVLVDYKTDATLAPAARIHYADGHTASMFPRSPAAAERFAAADPYVRGGLVKAWRVREWTTVIGPDAAAKPPDTGR